MSYFTYQGIKYILEYVDNTLVISKLVDNKKEPLTKEEEEKIKALFTRKYGYVYYSEKLDNIIISNKELQKYSDVPGILKAIENIIPKESRRAFYHNLETLSINLNLDAVNMPEIPEEECQKITIVGFYHSVKNDITFVPDAVKAWQQVSRFSSNPKDTFKRAMLGFLTHELLHMASTNYDAKENINKCGFDTYPTDDIEKMNRGLTEGFTEFLASSFIPERFDTTGYYFEQCLVVQIGLILGLDPLLDAYFGNKGIKNLAEKLTALGFPKTKSLMLFRNIEINYVLADNEEKQSVLGDIQSSLIDNLEAAINRRSDDCKEFLEAYEDALITPEKIASIGKNPDNYEGINESLNKFSNFKEQYLKSKERY